MRDFFAKSLPNVSKTLSDAGNAELSLAVKESSSAVLLARKFLIASTSFCAAVFALSITAISLVISAKLGLKSLP